MELKQLDTVILARPTKSINRTFMELKQYGKRVADRLRESINRTFMELKLENRRSILANTIVLIEPLWN